MASDRLFEMLAQAKSQPSKALRATESAGQAGEDILGGFFKGSQIRASQAEARLKPYEIYSKLSENIGPDMAGQVMSKAGLQVPTFGGGTSSVPKYEPEQLVEMGKFGKNRLDAETAAVGLGEKGPRTRESVKSNLSAYGMPPQAIDAWLGANSDATGNVQNKNYSDLIQALNAKASGQRGNMMGGRVTQMQLGDLPSRLGPNTAAGAAFQVKVAARQGKSLISKPGAYQRIGLSQGDAARAILRNSPTDEAMRNANFSNTAIGTFNQLKQRLSSDPAAIDQPLVRKELYDIFDEMDKSATPFIANHLQNMEDAGFTPSNWKDIKKRELGETLSDIPFVDGTGASTGTWKTATNAQGVKLRSSDNWATFEPVPPGGQ